MPIKSPANIGTEKPENASIDKYLANRSATTAVIIHIGTLN
jgi:hypothetical protein